MMSTKKHLFERQGFGPGPYRLVDVSECTTHTVAAEAGRDLGLWPEAPRAAGTCDSCGQCIRYVYTLESSSGTQFRTGCDCVLKAFEESLGDPVVREVRKAHSDFAAKARREGKARRERVQRRARLRMFVAQERGGDLLPALRCGHHIVQDIRGRVLRYGELSEKQAALVLKIDREERERALQPAEVHVPVPEVSGRVRVEGEAVSVKWHDNAYGGRLVMTVKVGDPATGCYLLWGSVPDALLGMLEAENRARGGDGQIYVDARDRHPLRGRRVAFMAAVSRSDRDEHFGFFKRPTKPELMGD
jgi:hypothetical protein